MAGEESLESLVKTLVRYTRLLHQQWGIPADRKDYKALSSGLKK